MTLKNRMLGAQVGWQNVPKRERGLYIQKPRDKMECDPEVARMLTLIYNQQNHF